jgi:hypothetical protein
MNSVYKLDGFAVNEPFNVDGSALQKAYDINRSVIFQNKTFSVLGDSYSTFTGDVYPQTNGVWYDGTNNGVTNKYMTWYRLLEAASGIVLERNASYSGTPICYDGWHEGTDDAKNICFYARANDVADSDYILVFGATNDSWIGVNIGEYKYSDWTEEDMKSFRPALARLLDRLKTNHAESTILFIKNTGLTSDIQNSISTICNHYSIPIITLSNITKTSGHPTSEGMQQICNQVLAYIMAL